MNKAFCTYIICAFAIVPLQASAQFEELLTFELPPNDVFGGFGDAAFSDEWLAISRLSRSDVVSVFDFSGDLVGSIQAPPDVDFGASVVLDGQSLVLGDPYFRPGGPGTSRTGQAYIYDTNSFELRHVVDEPESRAGQFGFGLDVSDGVVAVSRRGSNVYLVDSLSGEFLLDIPPPDGPDGFFGEEIVILGDTMLVGAPRHPPQNSGAFHIYDLPSGELRSSIFPDEPMDGALFGGELALTTERIFASAWGTDQVFAFDRTGTPVGQVSMTPDESVLGSTAFGRSMVATEEFVAVSLTSPLIGQVFLYDPITLDPIGMIDGTDWGQEFGRNLAAHGNLLLAAPIRGGPARLFLIPEPSTSVLACFFIMCLSARKTRNLVGSVSIRQDG